MSDGSWSGPGQQWPSGPPQTPGTVPPPPGSQWAGGPPPPAGPGPAAAPAPPLPNASTGRTLLIIAAVLLGVGGLVVAATPLGDWFTVSFGPVERSVNGYGAEDSSAFDSGDTSEDDLFTSEDTATESSDDDFDWILDPLPDGAPVTAAGLALALAGGALLLRSLRPAPTAAKARTEVLVLSGAAAAVAGLGLVWTAWSWFGFKDQWDTLLGEQLQGDDLGFGALFAGALDADPGGGLLLAGLSFVGLGLVAAVTFLGSLVPADRLPFTISVTRTSASPPAPAPWPPSAAPPSQPGWAAPATGGGPVPPRPQAGPSAGVPPQAPPHGAPPGTPPGTPPPWPG